LRHFVAIHSKINIVFIRTKQRRRMENVLQNLIGCFTECSENKDKNGRREQSLKRAVPFELKTSLLRFTRHISSLHLHHPRELLTAFGPLTAFYISTRESARKIERKFVTRRRGGLPFKVLRLGFLRDERNDALRRCDPASDWCFDPH
jgi:hypothetical protein